MFFTILKTSLKLEEVYCQQQHIAITDLKETTISF